MRITKSIRVSAQTPEGNWLTQETEVELSSEDLGIKEVQPNHRVVAQILDYECELLLVKTVKDPAFEGYIKERITGLAGRKKEIDDAKTKVGLRKA